ncbi:DNA repair protein rad52 [Emydomyces testavorans]|uniref:RAD52 homolog n=1 Tax=Emydomyces testavorans TaxID=2070801 RepID=A0AAF0II47_9EURO|nr:DNA repair protein rad52 [Emydomyces testavorans]
MPAPGDQHRSYATNVTATNPFEEPCQHINEYTAQEIATLQSRLDKRLGPEYISSRAGPGGQRVHYLAADKCINLANEIFGFNGWSSAIQNIQVDFVDENPNTGKITLGLSVIVRVTLKNGTYHEDIGYGHIENCRGKAAAFEKAKKEGTTDALKRTLRTFGNVLGNCIYDKDYLSKVTKEKAFPAKWDIHDLHRHADFVPIKKETVAPPVTSRNENYAETRIAPSRIPDAPTKIPDEPLSMDLENDFGSDAFDEADFGEHNLSHPDEVILEEEPQPQIQSHVRQGPSVASDTQNYPWAAGRRPVSVPSHMVTPSKPPQQTTTAHPTTGSCNTALPAPADRIARPNFAQTHQNPTTKPHPVSRAQQATLNDPKPLAGRPAQQNHDLPPPLPCDQSKAKAETGIESKGNHSPLKPPSPLGSQVAQDNPIVEPGVWYSARAANITEPGKPPPTFDPKFDSPSIRKTLTVDHDKSAPVTRKTFQNIPPQTTSQAPYRTSVNNAPPGSQSMTPIAARMVTDVNKRSAPGNFVSPARPPMTTSYRPPTRRSMAAAAANNSTNNATNNTSTSNSNTNVAQNLNGKRPPLSDVTNMPPLPGDNEISKKIKVGDSTTGAIAAGNNQQQRQGGKTA